jgi:cell division septum initiation protein DivIVA
MTEDRAPVEYEPSAGADLVPGMVTVVEEAPATYAAQPSGAMDGFDVVLRGYDRHQVDGHLARVALLVDQMQAELAGSAAREGAATAELARVSAELQRGRPSFDALGERVSQMLGLAETEADQMRSDADRDVAALRLAAEREAADIRSDARREAEELGAAARREVGELADRRVELLTEITHMRDALNAILAGATEQWPSLAPSQEPVPVDEAAQTAGEDAAAGEDLAETRSLDLTEAPATKRR